MTTAGFTDSLDYLIEKYYLAERLLATHPGPIKERLLDVAVSVPLADLEPSEEVPSETRRLIQSIPARLYAHSDESGRGAAVVTLEALTEEEATAIGRDICEVHDQLGNLEDGMR
jgi:hypothetical protein